MSATPLIYYRIYISRSPRLICAFVFRPSAASRHRPLPAIVSVFQPPEMPPAEYAGDAAAGSRITALRRSHAAIDAFQPYCRDGQLSAPLAS